MPLNAKYFFLTFRHKMLDKLIKKYKNMSVVARATLWFMFCGIMQKGIAFLTMPIFTRILTTEQYGRYSLYNSWLAIFMIFCTFRLEKAVFNKGMSKYPEERKEYVASMQVATSLLTGAVFILYLLCRNRINTMTGLSTFITSAMFLELIFHPAMGFFNLEKRYEYKYISVIAVTLSYTVFNTALGILAVLFSDEVMKGDARILSNIAATVMFGSVLYIYNFYKAHFRFNWAHIRFAVVFNIPLIPHYFSSYVLEQFDRLMISQYCGQSKVGIYSVAYNISLLLKLVTDSLHSAFTPWQYEKMREKKYREINDALLPIHLLVAGMLIVFMAFAPEVMKIIADEQYHEAVYAIPPISSSILFISLYGFYSNAEFYLDANKFSSMMTLIGAVLNIILNAVFIQWFGFIAAGYTTLVCYTIFAYAHLIYTNIIAGEKIGKKIFSFSHLLLLTISIYSAAVIMSCLYEYMLIRYFIIIVMCAILAIKRKAIVMLLKNINKKKEN